MSATTESSTALPTGTWIVDQAHSKVGFAVKQMGIATGRGDFTEFEGTLEVGENLASSRAYGTVKVQSVDTNHSQRAEGLRSPNFFDAADHPEIRFESTKIEVLDDAGLCIAGRLTMRGVTNEIVLHAEVFGADVDPYGNDRLGLEVTGQLSVATTA